MNNAPKLLPGRQYKRVGRTVRRIPIPMKPPIPSLVIDGDRRVVGEFPSRSQARKALWHILQDDANWPFAPFEVIRQSDL